MLILVGVTISVAINGGLFNIASSATKQTEKESELEVLQSAIVAAFNEAERTVNATKLESNLPGWTIEGEGPYVCTSEKNNIFTVEINGNVQNGDTAGSKVAITPKKETYEIGDAVTIGVEAFYVIADDNEKVTLLAKDNIDTGNLVQSASAGTVAFSTEMYWGSGTSPYDIVEPEATIDEATGKLTLPESHIAAKAAYEYGRDLGGTGRLMTHAEATALEELNRAILYSGSYGNLEFWLGSASGTANIWVVGLRSTGLIIPSMGILETLDGSPLSTIYASPNKFRCSTSY